MSSISNQSQYLFKKDDWDTLYSKSDYNSQNSHLTLHFLLARDQTDAKILEYISTHESALTTQDTRHGHHKLTPLIIATMKGRVKIVEAIITGWQKTPGTICNHLNQTDAHKWTALHHAILCSKEIYSLLEKAGANLAACTELCGTPANLKALTTHNIPSRSARTTFIQKADGTVATIERLAQQELKMLTGLSEYRDTPYVPLGKISELWQLKYEGESDHFELRQNDFRSFLQKVQPQVLITPCKELQEKSIYTLGLIAKQTIELSEPICVYSGKFITPLAAKTFLIACQPDYNDEYSCNHLDAKEMGNVARFINWGFPNTAISILDEKEGITQPYVLPLEKINPGDQILLDYGSNVQKGAYCEPHVLLGKEKMRDFFKNGLLEIQKQIDSTTLLVAQRKIHQIYETALQLKLCYALNVPGALLDLHFSGIIKAKYWESYVNNERCSFAAIAQWKESNPFSLNYVISLICRINELEEKLSDNKVLRTIAAVWVLKSIGERPVINILKGMEIICSNPNARELDTNALNLELKSYDWMKDQNAPLCFTRTAEDRFKYMLRLNLSKNQYIKTLEFNLEYLKRKGENEENESFQRVQWMLEKFKSTT